MKMKLFEVGIEREASTTWTCVVAPSEDRAVDFVREHYENTDDDYTSIKIARIDDTLEEHQRKGLEAMLDTAPVGFASHSVNIGWVVHAGALHCLRLYRIEEHEGDETFVIAPTADIAAAVWAIALELDGDEMRLYRIADGQKFLTEEQSNKLTELIEFGPVGVITWDDDQGWSRNAL